MTPTTVEQMPKSNLGWLIAASAATLYALRAEPACATQYAGALPWDQTLGTMQDILIGPVAHAAIALNFTLSAILYAIGSHRQAGRLLAGGLAACAALIAVNLLTFLSPPSEQSLSK
jgi:type IV secretory pathway VirB2 component (pilin)